MSRLRQLHSQNYTSSGTISSEFESIVRYLNAAEHGNKTVAELLDALFDDDGLFSGVIELRKNSGSGLEYRTGEYTAAEGETGWIELATLEEIRGAPGVNVSEIAAPIFYGRYDEEATAAQDTFAYAHVDTDELIVYVDGVLQWGDGNDYDTDPDEGVAGVVIFTSAMSGGEVVTIYKVRTAVASGYTRDDTYTGATQSVFPFVHTDDTRMLVYKNGLLQREGGAYDYTTSSAANSITFTSAVTSGNLVSIITIENPTLTAVSGLMFEADYVDAATGYINYSTIAIADDQIPEAKVANLTTNLAAKSTLTIDTSAPGSPVVGDFWLDTSETPYALKFKNATEWQRTTPLSSLPSFAVADASKILRVDGTGTALEFAAPNYSALIPLTQKAAASGVASLDTGGKLVAAQRPDIASRNSAYYTDASPTAASFTVERVWKRHIKITGISIVTSSGTCTVQLSINGVPQGSAYAASSVQSDNTYTTAIDVDATVNTRTIQVVIASVSAPADLEVILTYDEYAV